MESSVVLSIGSNINPDANIDLALSLLSDKVSVIALAPKLVTSPIGISDQADFVNTAVLITTFLTIEELNAFLKNVEDRVGRDRTRAKFGPREIDLDILAWNGDIVDTDYHSRPFLQQLFSILTDNKSGFLGII